MGRGKLVIAAIFALALAATGFSVWHHHKRSHRTLELWGPAAASTIARSSKSELLLIRPADEAAAETANADAETQNDGSRGDKGEDESSDRLLVGGKAWKVLDRKDSADTRGFLNIRNYLVQDDCYDWSRQPADCGGDWKYAIRFIAGSRDALVLLGPDCCCVGVAGASKTAYLGEGIHQEFRAFFAEQFPPHRQ